MTGRRGDGSIYRKKRKDGTEYGGYVLKYYNHGRRIQEYTGLNPDTQPHAERDARRLLKIRLSAVIRGTYIPQLRKLRIEDLYNALLADKMANRREGSRSVAEIGWRWAHLKGPFRDMMASDLTTDHLNRYITERREEGKASNATINRELATLRRAFNLAYEADKVVRVPHFPHLKEHNIQVGYLEDSQYTRMAELCEREGLWLRAMFEVGFRFGWRVGEVLGLRVRHVDLTNRVLRLDPDTTKNDKGRVLTMPRLMAWLLEQCAAGKQAEDFVFTRTEGRYKGKPVRDFRDAWKRVKCEAGVPDLHFHDLRRTAGRNMVEREGISELVAMRITGHKTRSMFDRYHIVSQREIELAAQRMDARENPAPAPHSAPISAPVTPKTEVPEPSMLSDKVQ